MSSRGWQRGGRPPSSGAGGNARGRGRWSAVSKDRGRGASHPSRGRGSYHPEGRGRSRAPNRGESSSTLSLEDGSFDQNSKMSSFIESFARKSDVELGKYLSSGLGRDLWISAWSDEGRKSLNLRDMANLVTVLARIPFSMDAPVIIIPLADYSKNMQRFIELFHKVDEQRAVRNVEACANAVKRLMKTSWNLAPSDVIQHFQGMLAAASRGLNAAVKEHRLVQGKIYELLDDLEKPWMIKTCQTSSVTEALPPVLVKSGEGSGAYLDWRTATISWLLTTSIFQPTKLPVMKVPGTLSQGVYDSPEDYFETVLKIWVAMTFELGCQALTPHCPHRVGNEGSCGRTLWAMPVDNSGSLSCLSPGCSGSVVLACPNKFHYRGLCGPCATKARDALRGPPGPRASTNIYDAQVAFVGFDGRIYASQLKSRRPPAIAPNWKTTRRLCAPNLIGVVFLPEGPKSSLRLSDRIMWGEIVVHSPQESRDEFKRREKRQIAFSLFDLSNVSRVTRLTNVPLKPGDRIAIIDCQIFVPEFIHVLIALGHQSVSRMPFQNGALLNMSPRLSLPERVVDDADSEGIETSEFPTQLSPYTVQDHHLSTDVFRANVAKLIDNSTIDPIVQLRRDKHFRDQLQEKLENLIESTTLDQGQMQSFLEALTHPVHCTLGPPGTGKSYVGVVMARALLIVRDLWIKTNPSVGHPPILVLSYKNHAIDEFLMDLVKSERGVSLTRIGGGCQESALSRYAERSVWNDDPGVKSARRELRKICDLRTTYMSFSGKLQSLLCARGDAMLLTVSNADQVKQRKKNTYDAASTLLEAIARTVDVLKLLPANSEEWTLDDATWEECLPSLTFERFSRHFKSVQNNDCSITRDAISTLYEGIKHYDQNIDISEILWKWLTGFVPQPPCCFKIFDDADAGHPYSSGDDDAEPEPAISICMSPCDPGSCFCPKHRCQYLDGFNSPCQEPKAPKKLFCAQHSCSIQFCDEQRLPVPQLFCLEHACRVCVESGAVAQVALNEYPHNTCSDHPVCITYGCKNLVTTPGSMVCTQHSIPCRATQCRMFGTSESPYCLRHQHLADVAAKSPSSYSQCQALTNKKNKPCKSKPTHGTKYCRDHQKYEVAEENPFLGRESGAHNDGPHRNIDDIPSTTVALPPDVEMIVDEPMSSEFKENLAHTVPDNGFPQETIESVPADLAGDIAIEDKETGNDDDWVMADDIEHAPIDDPDDVEEADHIVHLREVFGTDDAITGVSTIDDHIYEDDICLEENPPACPTGREHVCIHSSLWTWESSLDDRWGIIEEFLSFARGLQDRVMSLIATAITRRHDDLLDAEVRAKARAYEGKAVLGGTIVSCIGRLEAIRALNPFAVIVEEASEVLEPLLLSCIGSSTCKFEQIGDHFQLSPSLMSKFDYERINKINVSMFERLVRAPQENRVPYTVLSIQRRMRPNIADLTRQFYSEITTIIDHEICLTKVVGQSSLHRLESSLIPKMAYKGREVPGVAPSVFFWQHTGSLSRAQVGLSKVNKLESEMVCALAKYLVDCGVPKSSIALITPYKGQLMLIRRKLQDLKLLPFRSPPNQPHVEDACVVSTVDRFQGDEADLVIVSLVADDKSTSPFVKLRNRMIVLLSRARLGMIIVGNAGYFNAKGAEHWKRALNILNNPGKPDNHDKSIVVYDSPRMGNQLPLCCPLHRDSIHMARTADQVKLGFCDVMCLSALSCGHLCGLRCHWPNLQHNERCSVAIPSPCPHHKQDLTCMVVFAVAKGQLRPNKGLSRRPLQLHNAVDSIEDALKLYRCQAPVDVEMPCSHTIRVSCADENDISTGVSEWPTCTEPALRPYVYPCGHELELACSMLTDWERNPDKVAHCKATVAYRPKCGHEKIVACYLKNQYENGQAMSTCNQTVNALLPRCGHSAKLSCKLAETLESWSGATPDTNGIILEGQHYGPMDFACKEKVVLRRKCGHEVSLPCSEAFSQALSASRCNQKVIITNPECGHEFSSVCYKEQALLATGALKVSLTPLTIVNEDDESAFGDFCGIHIKCSTQVTLLRRCGHEEPMPCANARKPGKCHVQVPSSNPLCNHPVSVPCHLRNFNGWTPWSAEFLASESWNAFSKGVFDDNLPVMSAVPSELSRFISKCTVSVNFRRVSSCGHSVSISCFQAIAQIGKTSASALPECDAVVSENRLCGHEISFQCRHRESNLNRPCSNPVKRPCWNFDVCGVTIEQACHFTQRPSCLSSSTWTCGSGHSFKYRLCSQGVPERCPTCVTNSLELDIQAIGEADCPWIDTDLLPKVFKDSHLISKQKLPHNKDQLISRILAMMDKFRTWRLSIRNVWRRPIFQRHMTQWFIPLSKSPQKFNWSTLIKGETLSGVQVFPLTRENLERILLSRDRTIGDLHFVIGVAFMCHVLVDPTDVPNAQAQRTKKHKGKSVGQQVQQRLQWIKKQRSLGFDAVQLHAKDGSTSLVIWDPYALEATHIVSATRDQIASVASSIREIVNYSPVYIQTESVLPPMEASADVAIDDFKQRHLETLKLLPPSLSMLKFTSWDGHLFSKGVTPSLEADLKANLQFFNAESKKSPFAGLNCLENHSAKLKHPELLLFHCLELLHVVQSVPEAQEKFQEYVVKIGSRPAHPLTILAASRLAQKDNPDHSWLCLSVFTKCYSDHANPWVSDQELEFLRRPPSAIKAPSHSGKLSTKAKWEQLKDSEGYRSDAMEKLLGMTGLERVKLDALSVFRSAMQRRKMDAKTLQKNAMNLNFVFLGNPGTGKTTVARLFAQIFKDCGMRQSGKFKELTAQSVKDDGIDNFREAISECKNGTIIIDEAYDLDPRGDFKGKPIVAELLTASENLRDSISFILAGYTDDIHNKLFSYNEGLKSRFQEITFEDFDQDELETIWFSQLDDKGWSADPMIGKLVARELSKAANRKGFGNARAVRKMIDEATNRRMSHDDFDSSIMEIQIEDVVGENPLSNPKVKKILDEFQKKTGWASVKDSVKEFVNVCAKNYNLKLEGKPTCPVMLNRLFLGNPGTGKTTCAGLYARLLKELNFLSVGGVVFKTASDFVGSVVGESQKKAASIIENARGKVLVIDEAYNLDDGLYGKQVLDVIVEKVQDTESDDIAVLLLGYEKQLSDMMRNSNPGLARRFAFDYAFRFEDYDDRQLLDIFRSKCVSQEIAFTKDVCEKAIQVLSMQRSQEHFGNAGAIDNLLKAALAKASARSDAGGITLQPDDIEGESADDTMDPLKLLYGLYKIDRIRAKLIELRDGVIVAKREGDASSIPDIGHFVFRGNPGTGKTTVARVMSKILFQLGILPTNRVKETSGLGLTGEYLGQTKKAVEQQLGEARGGVLFIDEAYELGNDHYGSEAITSLVAAMTDPQYNGMVIILAGYAADMDVMLDHNSGLKSRISHVFDFDDWDAADCALFLKNQAAKESFSIAGAIDIIQSGCEQLIKFPGWANGRDVNTLWKKSKSARSSRVKDHPEDERTIQTADVEKAMAEMISARKPPETKPRESTKKLVEALMMDSRSRPSEKPQFLKEQSATTSYIEEIACDDCSTPGRDPGVSDEDWAELEKAKRLHEERIRKLKEEEDEEKRKAEERKAKAIQEKLRRIMPCPAGFSWYNVGSGWRCGGGSHYVSDALLNSQFSC